MSEVEKMKSSKFDKYLTRTDKIKMQLKQVFPKYYGPVDEYKRTSLNKNVDYEHAYNAKDVILLHKMLKAINFN